MNYLPMASTMVLPPGGRWGGVGIGYVRTTTVHDLVSAQPSRNETATINMARQRPFSTVSCFKFWVASLVNGVLDDD